MPSSIDRSRPGLLARIFPASNLIFLLVLGTFIIASPFLGSLQTGDLVNSALLTLVMVAGVAVVGARRATLVPASLLVAVALGARWVNHFHPQAMPAWIHLLAGILLLGLVAVQFLRFILRAKRVTAQVLEAGISTYLVFGLLWTLAYMLVGQVNPNAFTFSGESSAVQSMDSFNALYYSFVTLTTMGYGDIVPVSRAARMLAVSEATTGVLYMSVLIARLVGMYSTVTPIEDPDKTD
jgi:voltage-gated potassium channel